MTIQIIYKWNFFTPDTYASSQSEFIFIQADNVRGTNPIGCSDPLDNPWDMTASIPYTGGIIWKNKCFLRIKMNQNVNNALARLHGFTISNNHSTIDKGEANRGINEFTIIVYDA